MESHLVKLVRNIFGFYQSTTKLFIFIPRLNGGLGIKRISNVYYTTRLSFLIKMLNHSVENFRFIARESLKMDMLKRGVKSTGSENNFLGYELNDDSYLCTSTYYGCQSDWPDMVRYARKLNIGVRFVNDEAVAIFDNDVLPNRDLQKRLYQICIKQDLSDASKLSIQGPFLNLTNINAKATHSILYNWKLSDHLLRFVTKARLSILPTKFTTFIWNRENNPMCPFGCRKTESVAHLFNGCIRTFGNFYSKRHNRIVGILHDLLKRGCRFRIMVEKNSETVFPQLRDQMKLSPHRRPDIFVLDEILKTCFIFEVTVSFDLYLEYAHVSKLTKYESLVECLKENGYKVELLVLCFGSLGSVRKDVWRNVRKLIRVKEDVKTFMKDCSISNVIGANYIWRHRVKKLLS